MAITATVKETPDTSSMDFPAPSHVGLVGEAMNLTRQLREFYSSPDSTFDIPEAARKEIYDEVVQKLQQLPPSTISMEWIKQNVKVPSKMRLGDNPLFKAFNKS